MTPWDLFLQRDRVLPYWIASMHASIRKKDTRNVQRMPFARFTDLSRLSASFWSLKCQKKGDFFCYVSYLRYWVVAHANGGRQKPVLM